MIMTWLDLFTKELPSVSSAFMHRFSLLSLADLFSFIAATGARQQEIWPSFKRVISELR